MTSVHLNNAFGVIADNVREMRARYVVPHLSGGDLFARCCNQHFTKTQLLVFQATGRTTCAPAALLFTPLKGTTP
jgi:hypothetical protein